MSQNSEVKDSTTNNVLVAVADALNGSPNELQQRVKTLLVERELSKRVELLDKGMAKLRELKRELDKIRPPVSYTLDGTKVEGNFSKTEFESLKLAREKVSKLEAVLEKAWAGQEFDKLAGLVGGKEPAAE